MYEAFYGLQEKPFNLTPDPKYLYLSDKHKEAFAHLLFGIKNRSGFVMLTGEIGTGKTTICRNLLNQLDQDTEVAFIFNPSFNAIELLKKVNSEFGIDAQCDNALELVERLNQYLLQQAARGKNCVLVIDEAQNLSPQVLEQIRLLSNLETEKEKLIQIILIGQPELGEVLALENLRQLNQRITARYHLKPLTQKETLHYIAYRLHVAGGRRKVQFDKKAVRAVYKFSGGVPRMINALCDRCLLIGYTKEVRNINAAIVRRAAYEIRGERVRSGGRRFVKNLRTWLPAPTVVLAIVVVALVFHMFIRPLENISENMARIQPPSVPGRTNTTEAVPDAPPPASETASNTPETAAPEPETASQATFTATLIDLAPGEAAAAAAEAVLGAWDIAAEPGPAADAKPEQLGAYIERHDLQYEALAPTVDQLLALNMPAFVRMRLGTKEVWLGLVGMHDDDLIVTTGNDATAVLDRANFNGYYARQAVVPWRDPNPGARSLVPGMTSPAVNTLKENLHSLGRLGLNNDSNTYDRATAQAVSRLQAETGMDIDGIAGKQVRLVLSSWLDDDGAPDLNAEQYDATEAGEPPDMPEESATDPPADVEESAPDTEDVAPDAGDDAADAEDDAADTEDDAADAEDDAADTEDDAADTGDDAADTEDDAADAEDDAADTEDVAPDAGDDAPDAGDDAADTEDDAADTGDDAADTGDDAPDTGDDAPDTGDDAADAEDDAADTGDDAADAVTPDGSADMPAAQSSAAAPQEETAGDDAQEDEAPLVDEAPLPTPASGGAAAEETEGAPVPVNTPLRPGRNGNTP